MKLFQNITWCLSFLLLMGCGSGSNVETAKTTDGDLSNYDSFAFLPNSNPEGVDESYDDDEVNTAVIETINMRMREAGYELDRDDPDLLVLVSTKTNVETGTQSRPVYAGYPYSSGATTVRPYYNSYYFRGFNNYNRVVGYDTDTYQYKEGTLVINLVDRETRETVWKGVASDNIYNQGTTAATRALVNDIFEEYPLTD